MKLKRKLTNIQKGYAEVVYTNPETKEELVGEVMTETFVAWTDFEKDEVHRVRRWVTYYNPRGGGYGRIIVKRLTGYKTRKEALAALDEEMEEIFGNGGML